MTPTPFLDRSAAPTQYYGEKFLFSVAALGLFVGLYTLFGFPHPGLILMLAGVCTALMGAAATLLHLWRVKRRALLAVICFIGVSVLGISVVFLAGTPYMRQLTRANMLLPK